MPNFQKSKGFQLRSGNKADTPFKMMGSSSPAKQFLDDKGEYQSSDDRVKETETKKAADTKAKKKLVTKRNRKK